MTFDESKSIGKEIIEVITKKLYFALFFKHLYILQKRPQLKDNTFTISISGQNCGHIGLLGHEIGLFVYPRN